MKLPCLSRVAVSRANGGSVPFTVAARTCALDTWSEPQDNSLRNYREGGASAKRGEGTSGCPEGSK